MTYYYTTGRQISSGHKVKKGDESSGGVAVRRRKEWGTYDFSQSQGRLSPTGWCFHTAIITSSPHLHISFLCLHAQEPHRPLGRT